MGRVIPYLLHKSLLTSIAIIALLKASPVTVLFIGVEDLHEITILIRDAAKPQT